MWTCTNGQFFRGIRQQQLLEDLTLRSFGSRRAPQDDKLLHGASEMYTPSKLARSSNAPLHNRAVATLPVCGNLC